MLIYKVCPEGIQPCNMKNRDFYWWRYKKHRTKDIDASVLFKVGTLGPHISCTSISCTIQNTLQNLWLESSSAAPSYFPEFHQQSLKCLCHTFFLCWTHCMIIKSLLNHLTSFHRGMFKLNTKFDADSCLYLFSHFEWDGHTVHMLTQWHQMPPLTSTVKLSLFMHVHSSPRSLAATL